MTRYTPWLAASLLGLSIVLPEYLDGCASAPPPSAALPKPVQLTSRSEDLRTCQGLTEIHLQPPFGPTPDWKGRLEAAVHAAGGNAAYVHAPGYPPTEVAARAYICPDAESTSPHSLAAGVHGGEAPDIPPDFPQRRFTGAKP